MANGLLVNARRRIGQRRMGRDGRVGGIGRSGKRDGSSITRVTLIVPLSRREVTPDRSRSRCEVNRRNMLRPIWRVDRPERSPRRPRLQNEPSDSGTVVAKTNPVPALWSVIGSLALETGARHASFSRNEPNLSRPIPARNEPSLRRPAGAKRTQSRRGGSGKRKPMFGPWIIAKLSTTMRAWCNLEIGEARWMPPRDIIVIPSRVRTGFLANQENDRPAGWSELRGSGAVGVTQGSAGSRMGQRPPDRIDRDVEAAWYSILVGLARGSSPPYAQRMAEVGK